MPLLTRSRGRQRFFNQPFSPSQLFRGGIQGAWYDPSDMTTLFQDAAGTTPVTAVEQPVGLIWDKSQGLALGAEVVTNGTFATNVTGWTAQAGDTVSWDAGDGGRLKIDDTNGAGAGIAYQIINTVAGSGYTVQFSSKLGTAGQTRVYVGTAVGNASMALRVDSADVTNGTIFFIASGATAYLQFVCQTTSGFSYLLDISVKPVAGNHAFQSTAASRPVLRARYNLLTYSEDFGNAAWLKTNCTIASNTSVAPDGTTTADTMQLGAGTAKKHVAQAANTTGSRIYSIYVKYSSHQYIQMINNGAVLGANFDIQNGVAGTTYNTTSSITSVGNGWYRCTMTHSDNLASDIRIYAVDALNAAFDSSTSSTGDILLWGAQLMTGADAAPSATGNAYQRIVDAATYATGGVFRPYLAFDGVDDRLDTASIDFTATNKMTTFLGLSRLGASNQCILELSTVWVSNNGTFSHQIDVSAASQYYFGSKGTLYGEVYSASSYTSPATNVLTGQSDIGADVASLRINGSSAGTSALDQGTGNYGNYPMFIGRRGISTLPFLGRFYGLIVRGAASTNTEVSNAEQWLAGKTGLVFGSLFPLLLIGQLIFSIPANSGQILTLVL